MSLRELESIINQLEKSKTEGAGCKAGKKPRKSRKAGILTGGMDDFSGQSQGGILVGGMDDFSGESQGSGLAGGKQKRGRKKKGGELLDMAGESQGSGLEGGRYKKGVKMNSVPPQLSAWLQHVKQVRSQNPNLPYKEVLQLAKQSYR